MTTTQDYSLIHILRDYSIDLWKRQACLIMAKHGLISFIVHPDYIAARRAQAMYQALLAYLSQLRSEGRTWIALPREVNRWWRERSAMKLVRQNDKWRIEGPGAERARVAYARLAGERVEYTLEA